MIDPDVRKAIYQLHLAGTPLEDIARQFHISRNTARAIVRQQGVMPQTVRKDKIHLDPELLRRLCAELPHMWPSILMSEAISTEQALGTNKQKKRGAGQSWAMSPGPPAAAAVSLRAPPSIGSCRKCRAPATDALPRARRAGGVCLLARLVVACCRCRRCC